MTPRGAEQLFFCRNFHPFSEVGNSRLHSTFFNYSRFYGSGLIPERGVVERQLFEFSYVEVSRSRLVDRG